MKKINIKLIFTVGIVALVVLSFYPGNKKTSPGEIVFRARVEKVLEEQSVVKENGSESVQQNLLLIGLEKEWKNKDIVYKGIGDLGYAAGARYEVGDKVHVTFQAGEDGGEYYIVDYVRTSPIYLLALLFFLVVVFVGRSRGVKAIISLLVSFAIIIKFMIPGVIAGQNILLVAVAGAFAILCFNIYFTEGVVLKSHLAIVSVFVSLVVTFVLAWFFSELAKLTGYGSEEAMFLTGFSQTAIDLRGLLLAGILVGAIGVLDDVVIGQIEAVQQLLNSSPHSSVGKLFKSAYEVGNAHLGAIVNTLFLTYAGASLPLLLLFNLGASTGVSFDQIISNELIATEIIRTLVGSIGVALSVPVATLLAAKYLKPEKRQ